MPTLLRPFRRARVRFRRGLNFITLNYIRHTATWSIINRVLLATGCFMRTETIPAGSFTNTFSGMGRGDRWLPANPHITVGLRYQYIKQSDCRYDYKQNRVSIDSTIVF
jgi:hypothetical protein